MNTPSRRLGRGLGSLIAGGGAVHPFPSAPQPAAISVEQTEPEEESIVENTPATQIDSGTSSQLQELSLSRVVPNPHQPRKVIDPHAVGELAASIQSEGLLQPIVVRPTANGYELIAGERRWRAHQHLGKETILARVLEVSDLSSASLSLIENLQREELNPLEEAMGYQSLVSDFSLTQQEVAERMGKSRSHVTNLMRLLQLDGELRRLVAEAELSVGHAKVLLSVEDPERRLAIGRQAILEGWTVRQCEEALAVGLQNTGIPPRKKSSLSSLYEELAASATQVIGRKVKIKSTPKGRGSITLSFGDEKDLRSLLEKLGVN